MTHATFLKWVSYITSGAAALQGLLGTFSTFIPQPWGVITTTVMGGLVVLGHDISTAIGGSPAAATPVAPSAPAKTA